MKKIITVLVLFLSLIAFGQSFPPKKYEYYDFSKIEAKITDNQKLDLIKKCVSTKYLNKYTHRISKDGEFSNYHILDFNGDGLLDIIYSNKEEHASVAFFVNDKDSLRLVFELHGNFTKIDMGDDQLNSFQLINLPCCLEFDYSISNYEFKQKGDCFAPKNINNESYKYKFKILNESEFCVSLVDQYAYVEKTEFPVSTKIIDTLEVSEKAFLTIRPSKPTSTDFEEYSFMYFSEGNKAISELDIGIRCYILSEKQNEKGDVFCFVMLINTSRYNNLMKNVDYYQYGWIQKNKLK